MAAGLLSRVRRLPPRERALLAAAWLALAVSPLALCLVPFRRLRDWAESETTRRRLAGPPTPERVAALVEAAAQHHLVRTTCLARALVHCRLLRHMGHAARLVIGGTRGVGLRGPDSFEAHAWVACNGLALTAGGPIDRFTILSQGGASAAPPPTPPHRSSSSGEER